jgi:outer membrane receptor protein involved in Fe transport
VSRGYKAGGFNLGQAALLRAQFDPEYLWSLDVGAKGEWLERRLYADVTAFYMKRTDMQVSTGVQLDPVGDPNSYFFYTDNASGGRNLGLESSLALAADFADRAGRHTRTAAHAVLRLSPTGEDLSARDQAHAPRYQASLNATWRHPLGWMARCRRFGRRQLSTSTCRRIRRAATRTH